MAKKPRKTPTETLEKLQKRLILESFRHVPELGWGEAALRKAAKKMGVAEEKALLILGETPRAHIQHFLDWGHEELRMALRGLEKRPLKIREKVAYGVRAKLKILAPYREAERQAVQLLSRPSYAPVAMKALYDTADIIWRAAGDASADWNYYSKRGLLTAVYGSTLLFWLQDESEEYEDTESFLHRRIENVMAIQKIKSVVKDPEALKGAFKLFRKFAA